jgi:hypothetical protein
VRRFFRWLGSRFANCTSYRFELAAAGVSGGLAYTVGYEHTSVSVDGAPVQPYTLRVTHVYRREDGAGDRSPPCRLASGRSEPARRSLEGVVDHIHGNATPKTRASEICGMLMACTGQRRFSRLYPGTRTDGRCGPPSRRRS